MQNDTWQKHRFHLKKSVAATKIQFNENKAFTYLTFLEQWPTIFTCNFSYKTMSRKKNITKIKQEDRVSTSRSTASDSRAFAQSIRRGNMKKVVCQKHRSMVTKSNYWIQTNRRFCSRQASTTWVSFLENNAAWASTTFKIISFSMQEETLPTATGVMILVYWLSNSSPVK